MEIRYIRTTYGYTPYLFKGDDVYNVVKNINTNLYNWVTQNRVITNLGNQIISGLNTVNVPCVVFYYRNFYSNFFWDNAFPQHIEVNRDGTIYPTNEKFYGAGNSYIQVVDGFYPQIGSYYPFEISTYGENGNGVPKCGFLLSFPRYENGFAVIDDSETNGKIITFGTYFSDPFDVYVRGYTMDTTTINNLLSVTPSVYTTDPYSPGGGETETGGGEGDFDNTSDPIPEASLPTLSAVDAKFISLYTPTLAELQSLANYMWSPLFDIDTLKKMFADPMKVILGLSIVPFAVPSSGQQTITIGNISTGVTMTKASTQYVQIDCGTLNVNEYWGAYLDYSPYTKLEIYLPYIGTKQISVDDVMNKACHVYYNIDILTGACCAMIKCDDSVLYSYAGQCATSLPITGNDWTNVVSGAISVALTTAAYYAGGQTAPLTDAGALHTLSSSSQTIMQMKPTIEKTGSIAGSAGMLGVQSPYLILTRPRQALPNNQNHFTGYPSYVNVKLGDLTGMTFVEQVHLENVPCTSSEQSEIETLLKGGVIF